VTTAVPRRVPNAQLVVRSPSFPERKRLTPRPPPHLWEAGASDSSMSRSVGEFEDRRLDGQHKVDDVIDSAQTRQILIATLARTRF